LAFNKPDMFSPLIMASNSSFWRVLHNSLLHFYLFKY
jgi:hypothetical protein